MTRAKIQNDFGEKMTTEENLIMEDEKRYRVLRWIYDRFKQTNDYFIDLNRLTTETDLSTRDIEIISDYLSDEGLISQKADDGKIIKLEHPGIVEIENSIRNPQKSTDHFPAQVIQYFNAPVGSIQTGNQNIANVQQNFGAKTEDVINLLKGLREHISEDNKQEGLEYIEGLEAEVKSDKPSESRMKLFLKGLGGVIKDTGKELLVEVGKKVITGEIQFPN